MNRQSIPLLCLMLLQGTMPDAQGAEQAADHTRAESAWADDDWSQADSPPDWHGFIEAGAGRRLHADAALNRSATLEELRVRFEYDGFHGDNSYRLKGDLYRDGVEEQVSVDLREASYSMTLSDNWDLKVGQQILTWGTGDLLFLNDLFAKDWQSFFSGRDTEYLKAPSAAARASYFGSRINLDLVWIPDFTPDRYIEGERFSFFSPSTGGNVAAPAARIDARTPADSLANSEWAVRLFGTEAGFEWALYGYRGFQSQPNAIAADGTPRFTRLTVVGGSVRSGLGNGLINAEVALHRGDDRAGSDPYTPNDQVRLLLGYQRELLPRLTLGLQYYLEQTRDFAALKRNSRAPVQPYLPDELRYLYTVRLSYRMWQDNLNWSLFTFYSPSDGDQYIRPSVSYRFDDQLSVTLGANYFSGSQPHTFFSQFEAGSNLYGRIRYAF